jgi:hypothetical protein
MKLVITALLRAIVTQLHPRMLWLAVWPFLAALLIWGTVGFVFREPVLGSIHDLLFGLELTHWIEAVFRFFGVEGLVGLLVPLLYGLMLLALAVMTALFIIGTVVMPSVVDHIATRHYARLEHQGSRSFAGSWANAAASTLLCVLGWILTMPLWLLLPLAVLFPWFWWSWLTTRILRYDALAQHASQEERHVLYHRHHLGFIVLGFVVSALNFVPPLFFLAPIFAGIVFTHYGLTMLELLRSERGLAQSPPDATGSLRPVVLPAVTSHPPTS